MLVGEWICVCKYVGSNWVGFTYSS